MAFKTLKTVRLNLPFFPSGAYYSAEADRRRFVYLDYNLESYLGIIGVGLIDGWSIADAGGLYVTVGYGTAIINGIFSDSPFVVKNHEDVDPSDIVITTSYYSSTTYTPDLNFYDPELGQTAPDNPSVTVVYDKVLYNEPILLTDDSDNYIYIYRNGAALSSYPYYAPDNGSPVPESISGSTPLYTAVAFGVTQSLAYAQSSGKLLIGRVVTRNGAITLIDTSKVAILKDLYSTIWSYGKKLVINHRHGGSNPGDPKKIVLRTDIRDAAIESAKEGSVVYQILYSDPTSVELGHKHYYSADSDGDGVTVTIVGSSGSHYHEINEYVVGDSISSDSSVETHTHAITISDLNPDTWDVNGDYVIYINGEPYYGEKATVSSEEKTITFTGDVTVVKRKYMINKEFSDGSTYVFESEESSIYRFMLKASLDYYSKNADAISSGTKSPLILPDPSSPVTLLKKQCVVAEQQLSEAGDVFVFSGEVAPDPVSVILVEPGHVDSVKIEISSNSEVTGKLRSENILYLPASKFTSGQFDIGTIPILSHLGRYLEQCYFDTIRTSSYDGYVYECVGDVPFGNNKIIYSCYKDSSGNLLLGTSDGLYEYPYDGAYLFVINGVKIITHYGDLTENLVSAMKNYASKTGNTISIDREILDPQIVEAEKQLSGYGTYFKIVGSSSVVDGEIRYDEINIFFVEGYKIPVFGYEAIRLENEILENEQIVEEIKLETPDDEEDSTEVKSYRVMSDFNRSSVKNIIVEENFTDVYGGLERTYFTVASDYISKASDPSNSWELVYQSSSMGYICGIYRTYNGYYIAYAKSGIYACLSRTSSEYKPFTLPESDTDINGSSFGFDDHILMSYGVSIAETLDFGLNWTVSNVSDSPFYKIIFDPKEDRTTVTSSHYHDFDINYAGNGVTNNVYDESGTLLTKDHVHSVVNGVVQEIDSHVHNSTRTFYAFNTINEIYKSSSLGVWEKYCDIPTTYGEIGTVFVCFNKIIVCTKEKNIYTEDGVVWSKFTDFEEPFFAANWNNDNDIVYLGCNNVIYAYNGSAFSIEKEFEGCGSVSVYVDDAKKNFGYILSNSKRKIDFLGINKSESTVDAIFDFGRCYTLHGGWSPGVDYDLYVNDMMVKSTRDLVYATGENIKAIVNCEGYIDFAVSSLLEKQVSYGDDYIDVVSGSDFPDSGYIRLSWNGEFYKNCVFFNYDSKSDNRIYLAEPSQFYVPVTETYTSTSGQSEQRALEVDVDLMTGLGVDDNILITIYEGKLINVGKNTHDEIEDALSIKNIGTQKSFADIYLSNFLHFTTALKYAISTMGDDYRNYFVSLFDYNDIPGDSNNIDRFIDRAASDLFSKVMYSDSFSAVLSIKINRIIFGFGDFSGIIFVATNSGLFSSKINLGYEANWFRVSVEGNSVANDILQTDDSTLFVCAEGGLYKNQDILLSSWTKYSEDAIGGIPLRINPRWSDISVYNNGGSYWWQGWQGVTHSNSNLINSIMISGLGFASVTNDYGLTWQKSGIVDIDGGIVRTNYSLGDPFLLHNGSTVCCLKNVFSKKTSVIYSSGDGSNWNEIFQFFTYSGTITSYKVTDYNNVLLSILYSGNSASSGRLRNLKMNCGGKDFNIIENTSSTLLVQGLGVIDVLSGNDSFIVNPVTLNCINELPEGNICVGTNNGVMTDKGVFLAYKGKSSGIVKKIGLQATVTSLNINGRIKSLVFSASGKTIISTSIGVIVNRNYLVGYKLKFANLTDMTVISNEKSRADGSTIITVTCDWQSIPSGLDFSAVAQNNKIYVSYDSIVKGGELAGGKLYLYQPYGDSTYTKNLVPGFDIISNTSEYIEIKKDSEDDQIVWEDLFVEGSVVYFTYSNKNVPIFVDFTKIPQSGSLKGNYAVFKNVSDNLPEISLRILDNTENAIYVPHEFVARVKDINGNYSSNMFITYSCVYDGDIFSLKNADFESLNSFNMKKSSVDIGHCHSLSMYGNTISGTISSIGENSGSYVDLNVNEISDLNSSPFLGRPTLLADNEIIIFDPENYSRTYRTTIVSATSTVIRVKRNGEIFNISGTESMKISSGFRLLINAELYGVTGSVIYDADFIVKRDYLTAPTYIKGSVFYVASTSGLLVGNYVRLRDSSGISFKTKILSVDSETSFTVEDQSPFNFELKRDPYYELLYGLTEVGVISLTSSSALNTYSVFVNDTSLISVGDIITMKDNKGQLFVSSVSNIVDSTEFEVSDLINSDYTISNSSYIIVQRANFIESHIHVVRNGEFFKVENANWQKRGYSLSHGHSVCPFIKEVLDIKTINGKTYVCGNNSKIYSSIDSGLAWGEEVDLTKICDVDRVPEKIQIISTNGEDILFGCNTGSIVYHSTIIPSVIIPLEKPIG